MTPARVLRREHRGAGRPKTITDSPARKKSSPHFRRAGVREPNKPPARAGLDTARAGPERTTRITE